MKLYITAYSDNTFGQSFRSVEEVFNILQRDEVSLLEIEVNKSKIKLYKREHPREHPKEKLLEIKNKIMDELIQIQEKIDNCEDN
jgi:hypothetical protein